MGKRKENVTDMVLPLIPTVTRKTFLWTILATRVNSKNVQGRAFS